MTREERIFWKILVLIGFILLYAWASSQEAHADDIYTKVKKTAERAALVSSLGGFIVEKIEDSGVWEYGENLISYSMEYIVSDGRVERKIRSVAWAKKKNGKWMISQSAYEVNPESDFKLKVVPQ